MKKIDVEKAVGMTLCHDITAMRDDFKGAAFHRGHVITAEDVPALFDLGKRHIYVWEPDAEEIHEEDAALRMAAMAAVEGARYEGPSEGKMLLKAESEGLWRVDTALLERLNSIEDVTICTLPDHYPARVGARLASMRIVPLVTREANIAEAERLCAGRALFRLLPYHPRRVGVIVTGSEIYSGRIKDKFEPVIRAKLAKYPGEILGVTICDDDLDMIVTAARRFLASGADFLVFTGGMSVDPDDLTPTAIRRLGADIVSHGVPAQPGNMTLVAYLGDVPVMGVPGAAIRMPTTMLDVLLPAVYAGERITKTDLVQLGNGGLCQTCERCQWPNCSFGRY